MKSQRVRQIEQLNSTELKKEEEDFAGGSVAKIPLSLAGGLGLGTRTKSLIRELDLACPNSDPEQPNK